VWDYKPYLRQTLALDKVSQRTPVPLYFPVRGDTSHIYFYDLWANIHYGYVGRALGFSALLLHAGANCRQLLGAIPVVGPPLARNLGRQCGMEDAADYTSEQIGIDLWDRYGDNFASADPQVIGDEVVRRRQVYLGDGVHATSFPPR
jgi:hypothetical protein